MDRALLALCALLLNAAFAGPRHFYAPLRLHRVAQIPQRLLRDLERKLNRDHRSHEDRKMRGAFLLVTVIILASLAGLLGDWLFSRNLQLFELLLLVVLLPVRQTYDLVLAMRKALQSNQLLLARQTLEGTVWRHHALLDEHGLARACVEILAVNFSEKILAPVFWYVWFGLPGFLVVLAVTLLQGTLIKPSGNGPHFATATGWFYTALHYIPSRLAVFLCVVAAWLLPAANPRVFADITREMLTAPSHVVVLRIFASVLKLSLGGSASAYGSEQWHGGGSARPTASDIRRALYLFALLNLLLFTLLGLFL